MRPSNRSTAGDPTAGARCGFEAVGAELYRRSMALARPVQPIDADDETLRSALEVSDLPALLPALAMATGDLGLLRPELRIDPLLMIEEQGGLTPEQQEQIRALA